MNAELLVAAATAVNHYLVRNPEGLFDALHDAGATLRMDLDKIDMLYFDGMTYRISRPFRHISMSDAIGMMIEKNGGRDNSSMAKIVVDEENAVMIRTGPLPPYGRPWQSNKEGA